MPTASDYMRRKTSVPSELRTKEWGRVDTWCKERAFFMASVDNADTLDLYRGQVQAIVDGRVSAAQARESIRRMLADTGYKAAPGLEGTIKDLSTRQRRDVTLETNVSMARGWAQYQQSVGDITNPGLMLYRSKSRKSPRDWVATCSRFAGRDDVVLTGNPREPMVALSCSPVWMELSRFGNPYPPFDYGSGMWTKPVSYDECVRLGLITEDNAPEMLSRVDQAVTSSLNADLSVERDYRYRDLAQSLSDQLQGLAEWRDNKLVMTDPNGSRPYDWREVGKVISAPLPAGIPNYQAKAFGDWIEDHHQFFNPTDKSKPHDRKVGLDEREDLIRLYNRITPSGDNNGADPIYRGISFASEAELKRNLKMWDKSGYRPWEGKIADSWSASEGAVAIYAKAKQYGVIMRSVSYKSRKRIDDLYHSVTPSYTGPNPKHPIRTEGESVFMGGIAFRAVNFEKKGDLVYVDVEEI